MISGKKINKKRLDIEPVFRFVQMRSAHNYNFDDTFTFEGETHIAWEFVYVVSGCISVTEDSRLYELSEGDMIVHGPMEFHTIRSAKKTSPNVYVTAWVVEGELPSILTEGVFHLTNEEQDEYKKLFFRLHSLFHSDDRKPLVVQACSDSLSSFLIRISFNHQAQAKLVRSRSAKEYERIVLSMTEKVYENCSLEELASINNISISNMKVLFRKYCGISPKLYYSRLRISEAIRLMAEGLTAAETANKMNFSSPNYFNTFFKRMTGKPPGAFNRKATK